MTDIPIVWIELGRKLPHHLLNNVRFHYEKYPDYPQYLVTDQRVPRKISQICSIVDSATLDLNIISDQLLADMNRNTKQETFWINTTKRFFILEAFMRRFNLKKIVHLESDNLLLEGEALQDLFANNDWGLAYPMQADGIGCASILLVKDVKTLSDFNGFALKSWKDENQDDMQLLGKFSTSQAVKILPSYPGSKYIFDPQTYGRYFLGTDARNIRIPMSRRGIIDRRAGAVNPELLNFQLDIEKKVLFVKDENSSSVLANLHIHSKRIPRSWQKLRRILILDIENSERSSWERGHLDFRVFTERLASWILRRVFKVDKEIRLR
jgi:hypothetical protein